MLVQILIDVDALLSAQHPDTVLGLALVTPIVLGTSVFLFFRQFVPV